MSALKHRSAPSGPGASIKHTMTKTGVVAGTATVTNATVTVAGARTTDLAEVNSLNAVAAGVCYGSPRVSGADEVEIPLINPTAAKVTVDMSIAVELSRYTL